MQRIVGICAVALQFIFLTPSAPAARAAELPVEVFFRDYEFIDADLSPDGQCLALIGPSKGRRNVLALDLQRHELTWLTGFTDRNVYSIRWATDRRLLLKMEHEGFGTGGYYAVNRDGSEREILVGTWADKKSSQIYIPRLLSVLPEDPEHVLVSAIDTDFHIGRDEAAFPHVELLDIFSGFATLVEKNPGDIIGWLPDNRGVVRLAVELRKEKLRFLHRPDPKSKWESLVEYLVSDDYAWPVRFTPDNRDLIVQASNGRKTTGLYLFDIANRRLGDCLAQHAEFDMESTLFSLKDNRPLCVFFSTDRPQCQWFDARWQAAQAGIDKALPQMVNQLVSMSRDEMKGVFLSFSDRTPGTYYLFDMANHHLEELRRVASWIKPVEMSPMKAISYRARDGLTIHGYLTLPLDSAGTNLPLVVLPHGGPWVRDTWGFDPEVQFLANRGYAVLQMNFRGSTGYGFAFEQAGRKEWGLRMQDDITDGVQWAIRQGIADKNRICIFGASYGGYAAMMGLVQTPELYKCGINYAGVTDLRSLLRTDAYQRPRRMGHEKMAVGDTREDKERLEATSPINHVDRIRAPVLLIYGEEDPRVKVSQGKRLARELKKHGKEYEMILEEKEGHGFHIEKNKIEMYRKLDAFLKKHL